MQEPSNIKPLTSLRFVAAMWVVLFHYWPKLTEAAHPAILAKGYLGVELFFVLSGFILSHVYLRQVEDGSYRYGSFLWARLARVYPLHIATLAGVGLMALAAGLAGMSIDGNIVSWDALPANLFMVHAWGLAPVAGWNHPSWSISAEWFAYLSFPAFAWASLKLQSRPMTAVAAAVAFLAVLYILFERMAGFSLTEATIAWGALRIVPCFALGCAVHLLWKTDILKKPALAAASAAGLIAAVIVLASIGAPDACLVILFGGLILALASLSGAPGRFASHPAFVYLGEISYSVYMVCVPWALVFVNAAVKLLHLPSEHLPLWLWLIFVGSVAPVAACSYHLVERPAREAMRKWAKGRVLPAFKAA
ncbi:acyltransferase [soil metagenome]